MLAGCFQDGWVISASGAHDIALSFLPFVILASNEAQNMTLPNAFKRHAVLPNANLHNVKNPGLTWMFRDDETTNSRTLKTLLAQGAYLYQADNAMAWLELYLNERHHPFVEELLAYQQSADVLHWKLKDRELDLRHPQIMGILNLSADSFAQGIDDLPNDCAAKAAALLKQGADILDIGAESTRPGASPISADDERQRLDACLKGLRSEHDCPISVDSYHVETAKWLGQSELADIINDIGLVPAGDRQARDRDMLMTVKESGMAYVMMAYEPHGAEVLSFQDCLRKIVAQLEERIALAFRIGLDLRKILVDPGIGFGKGLDNDIRLITMATPALACLGRPVLIAHSRKRCIGHATGRALNDRDQASIIATAFAFHSGASVLRIHHPEYANDARTLAAIYRDTP